jgi:hypothetical protein
MDHDLIDLDDPASFEFPCLPRLTPMIRPRRLTPQRGKLLDVGERDIRT